MIMTMENAAISGPRSGSGVDAIVYSGLVIKDVEFCFAENFEQNCEGLSTNILDSHWLSSARL